jgi:hypothetical protein
VKNTNKFICSGCGACCRSVGQVKELKSTNGICDNLNQETNKCNIYESRPLICRVDDYYNKSIDLTRKQWNIKNTKACHELIDKLNLDSKFKIDIKEYERE